MFQLIVDQCGNQNYFFSGDQKLKDIILNAIHIYIFHM